jgi:hypothetical protein
MDIRIVEVPPGKSPLYVRRAWVGLILPLAPGATGPQQEGRATSLLGCLRQWIVGREWEYVVPTEDALNILERAAPEAAAWQRANAPEQFGPGQTFVFPAWACKKVVRLAVGSREVLVDTAPLAVGGAKGFRSMRLRRRGDRRLVLRPTGFRLFSLIWFLGAFVFLLMGVKPAWVGHPNWELNLWGPALMGLPLLAIGTACFILPRTYVFDRVRGLLRVSRFGLFSRQERPLQEALAVQLVSQRSSGRGRKTTYQMNLILLDDQTPRLCLSNDNYWNATRANAAELADFLGVPLLDEVSAADAPVPSQ